MKLYDGGRAPNPRRVRIFLAEKGITVPAEQIDLGTMQQRSEAFTAINPMQRVPALLLDDGTVIAESIAICRYFEALHPDPPLFGVGAVHKALVDMWVRRIEFQLMQPVGNFWRHAHPRTAGLLHQYKDFGESNRALYSNGQRWLDAELADGREFIAGETLTMADICALSTVDFAHWIGLDLDPDRPHLAAWHARVKARPSAAA